MSPPTSAPIVPLIPESAPFSPEQRAWLNGFFAGLFSRSPAGATAAAEPALAPLTILFGSQTGTAERLAKKAAKEAGKRNFAATLVDLAGYSPAKLAGEKHVLFITSTYGDGEPPDNAKAFHAALHADGAPAVPGLRFSVCGLGDTNYARFCQCGKDFDARLEKLGAVRIAPRADCDLDCEAAFGEWLEKALNGFGAATPAPIEGSAVPAPAADGASPDEEEAPGRSRRHPVPATLTVSRVLNLPGSAKEVRHVEFSLEGTGLAYEPGDALGVFPRNCPDLVGELLAALGCDGEEAVRAPDGSTTSFRHALIEHYDLGRPSQELSARYAAPAAGGGTSVATAAMHVIDVVLARPETRLAPAEFIRLLKPIQPRLYSISSGPSSHPGRVHLTVGVVRYDAHGRNRLGLCSTFLADRCAVGSSAPVFVHRNPAFKLPDDPAAPAIMVGPGTGVAPFRAFLEERAASGAAGRNWLFFGDQHAATDFLYKDELLDLRERGVLTRLDLAFSRDQADKLYVQHRLRESAAEVYAWLEAGAHFYVCGDASRMARDVDAALHQVVKTAGGKTDSQAEEYVRTLRAARRYARDVY